MPRIGGSHSNQANAGVQAISAPSIEEFADFLQEEFNLHPTTLKTTSVSMMWQKASTYGVFLNDILDRKDETGTAWLEDGGSERGRMWFKVPTCKWLYSDYACAVESHNLSSCSFS